ncbi:hypothetical protein M9H77_01869 [Catharanthus roseus]|uniref:Uncharacterized protein n=1 Tax=Catharanthus roseus TaxID=4058 RepID=A0ACC0C6Z5_CATRO|nr:hypothetical protein M9H77_01869 [Catharanthus roseus]
MRRVSLNFNVNVSVAIYSSLTVQLHAVVHGSFRRCMTDKGSLSHTTDLGMVAYPCVAASADPTCSGRPSCSTWCYMRLHIRDSLVLAVEDLSSSRDEYIKWYRDITRAYIENLANRDIRTVGYQPVRVDRWMMTSMLQEVDAMALEVIQALPPSPSQIASFAKKVQTIIWRCMVSIGGTLGGTPSQHDIQ